MCRLIGGFLLNFAQTPAIEDQSKKNLILPLKIVNCSFWLRSQPKKEKAELQRIASW
jgi:hypothetical protein